MLERLEIDIDHEMDELGSRFGEENTTKQRVLERMKNLNDYFKEPLKL